MKKNRLFVIIVFTLTILFSSNILSKNDISIFIDGKQKIFSPSPIIQDGTTLVPMRASFETLGCKIYWDSISRSAVAIRDDIRIKVTIGSNVAFINNNKIFISTVPQIIGESTYVPLRFISESLGAQVKWNGDTRTITILDKTKQEIKNNILSDTQKYELRKTFYYVNKGDNVDVEFDVLAGAISDSPYQKDISYDISPSPDKIYNDDYGNTYAKIKLDNIKPNQEIQVVLTKQLASSAINYNIDSNIIKTFDKLDNINIYTSPQLQIESDHPTIIKKAKELSIFENNPYHIAKSIFGFVNTYLTYDSSEQYARKGALSALNTGRGLCEDYSKLFVALLRANQIPARSVFGYWLTDENKKDINYNDWHNVDDLAHEWPEFYLNDYGWIIAEPTYLYTINDEKMIPWTEFANQNSNGHIIYGYESNDDNTIIWETKGYGSLDLVYNGSKNEIRKIK